MEDEASYAIVWNDSHRPVPVTGQLLIIDGHVILIGNTPGKPRLLEFDTDEIEALEIIRGPDARLRGRPTLVLALRDGSLVRISELNGFGIVGEIAHTLAA